MALIPSEQRHFIIENILSCVILYCTVHTKEAFWTVQYDLKKPCFFVYFLQKPWKLSFSVEGFPNPSWQMLVRLRVEILESITASWYSGPYAELFWHFFKALLPNWRIFVRILIGLFKSGACPIFYSNFY
jgi:hypothetical protein